ncbi:modulator of drug activity B [Escherichia coli]|nr:modulator of drug activity B [Escherichia coli]
MSNILIINGAKKFAHSNGQLNDTLTEVADGTLRDLGHDVRIVRADSDYDVKAEVQNFLWADVVIWQMPGWWMGAPWTVKKYIDDVFTEGHGTLYASDGRTRKDPSKKYGSGGLVQGKKYMLSLTWNAPMEAFTEKISSSTALALTVCICRSIKQTNSSVWNRCRHLSLMT